MLSQQLFTHERALRIICLWLHWLIITEMKLRQQNPVRTHQNWLDFTKLHGGLNGLSRTREHTHKELELELCSFCQSHSTNSNVKENLWTEKETMNPTMNLLLAVLWLPRLSCTITICQKWLNVSSFKIKLAFLFSNTEQIVLCVLWSFWFEICHRNITLVDKPGNLREPRLKHYLVTMGFSQHCVNLDNKSLFCFWKSVLVSPKCALQAWLCKWNMHRLPCEVLWSPMLCPSLHMPTAQTPPTYKYLILPNPDRKCPRQ